MSNLNNARVRKTDRAHTRAKEIAEAKTRKKSRTYRLMKEKVSARRKREEAEREAIKQAKLKEITDVVPPQQHTPIQFVPGTVFSKLPPEKKIKWKKCGCAYCTKFNSFPVLWKLPQTDGTHHLWYEIPKNATVTMKKFFFGATNLDNVDDYIIHDHTTLDKGLSPIIIYRDPVERFLSGFKNYCLEQGHRWTAMWNFARLNNENFHKLDIQERLLFLAEHLHKMGTAEEVHHFYPQTSFIDTEYFDNYTFIHIDRVSSIFNETKHLNETYFSRKMTIATYTMNLIKEIYYDDYVFFNKHGAMF